MISSPSLAIRSAVASRVAFSERKFVPTYYKEDSTAVPTFKMTFVGLATHIPRGRQPRESKVVDLNLCDAVGTRFSNPHFS